MSHAYFLATISRSFASERLNQIHPTLSNIVLCRSPSYSKAKKVNIGFENKVPKTDKSLVTSLVTTEPP